MCNKKRVVWGALILVVLGFWLFLAPVAYKGWTDNGMSWHDECDYGDPNREECNV